MVVAIRAAASMNHVDLRSVRRRALAESTVIKTIIVRQAGSQHNGANAYRTAGPRDYSSYDRDVFNVAPPAPPRRTTRHSYVLNPEVVRRTRTTFPNIIIVIIRPIRKINAARDTTIYSESVWVSEKCLAKRLVLFFFLIRVHG